MSTLAKPITKFITLNKPFDITNEFSHKKKKPTGVILIMIPQYDQDTASTKKTSHGNDDVFQFTGWLSDGFDSNKEKDDYLAHKYTIK